MNQFSKNNRSQKGVALIITIILMGIMLTSVGLFTKEMVDEVRSSTRIDNSLVAYYAAEAGLEEALLEFRYDNGAEISYENDANQSVDVTSGLNNTPRCVDLDANLRKAKNFCAASKLFTTRYYAVKMWYKEPMIDDLVILKDDVAELEIPDMAQTGNVQLKWYHVKDLFDNEIIPPGNGFRVEITTIDGSTGEIIPAKGLLDDFGRQVTDSEGQYDGKFFTDPFDTQKKIWVLNVGTGKKMIRIKPWYTKKSPNADGSYSEGSPISGGIIPSIGLDATKEKAGGAIGGVITSIESIGYYGGVARKITAELDRSSGNIVNLFDFVIYSGSELIK